MDWCLSCRTSKSLNLLPRTIDSYFFAGNAWLEWPWATVDFLHRNARLLACLCLGGNRLTEKASNCSMLICACRCLLCWNLYDIYDCVGVLMTGSNGEPNRHDILILRPGPWPGFRSRWGQKPKSGPQFLNTILDVCSNRESKHETGGTDFKWGAGHHWPPAGITL